jgi:hypothetical protein
MFVLVWVTTHYLDALVDLRPHALAQRIQDFAVVLEAEDVLEALDAQLVSELLSFIRDFVHEGLAGQGVLHHHSQLGVSRARHASVVDVRASDQRYLVVHDHALGHTRLTLL